MRKPCAEYEKGTCPCCYPEYAEQRRRNRRQRKAFNTALKVRIYNAGLPKSANDTK